MKPFWDRLCALSLAAFIVWTITLMVAPDGLRELPPLEARLGLTGLRKGVLIWTSLAVPPFLWWLLDVKKTRRNARRTGRRDRGLCPSCGYSLRGNTSGACPECGTPTAPRHAGAAGRNES